MAPKYRSNVYLAGGLLVFAFWLLILPLRWLIGALIAGTFHELCHIAAVYLCGGRITAFSADQNGAVLSAESLPPQKLLVCSLAGPVGGLILLLFAKWIPVTAICGCMHSVYNLLPIYPLDGGRALRAALQLLLSPAAAERAALLAERCCLTVVVLLGCVAAFGLKWGVMPLISALCIILRKNSLQTGTGKSTIGII